MGAYPFRLAISRYSCNLSNAGCCLCSSDSTRLDSPQLASAYSTLGGGVSPGYWIALGGSGVQSSGFLVAKGAGPVAKQSGLLARGVPAGNRVRPPPVGLTHLCFVPLPWTLRPED